MAYVSFKRGTQANLNKYLYTYTQNDKLAAAEGTFYLTSDTNRLYIGKDVSTTSTPDIRAVPINQGAIPVSDVAHLPTPDAAIAGQFYYVVDSNILCVVSGRTDTSDNTSPMRWVQINPNTNDNDYVNERTVTASKNSTTGVVSVADILYNTSGATVGAHYDFTGSEGFTVNVTPKYRHPSSSEYNASATYYSESGGTYSVANGVNSSNVTSYYIQEGYTLTLVPTVYTITGSVTTESSKPVGVITVADNAATPHTSSVKIRQGDNVTIAAVTGANDAVVANEIKISATDTTLSTFSVAAGNSATTNPSQPTHGWTGTVTDTSGKSAKGHWDPVIRVGANTTSDYHFTSGVAILNGVYTKTEVDNLIRDFNAMEYQGTVTSANRPTSNVKNGYVWMANGAINWTIGTAPNTTTVTARNGDLLIAHGTEGADGYIPSGDIQWDVITSSTNYDTSPTYEHVTHGFKAGKETNGATTYLGQFDIAVNSYLTATDSDTSVGTAPNQYTRKTVTIAHKEQSIAVTNSSNATATQATADATMTAIGDSSTAQSLTIPVPTISYDSAGHITGIKLYNYVVKDSAKTLSHSVSVSGTADSATVTSSATVTHNVVYGGANNNAAFNIASSSLTVKKKDAVTGTNAANAMITVNIEWGSF